LIGQTGVAGSASGREMDSSYSYSRKNELFDVASNDDFTVDTRVDGTDRGDPPGNIQLLAAGINVPHPKQSQEGPHGAHLTHYDTSSEGFVLSAGSMMFGGSLIKDAHVQTIIKNALNECLA
jgi:hypothetical protein